MDELDPIEFEINGELDLHTFRPSEVGELVPDYISFARKGYQATPYHPWKGYRPFERQSLLLSATVVWPDTHSPINQRSWGAIVWLK